MPPGPFQFAGSFTSDSSSLFYERVSDKTKEDLLRYDMKTGASEPVLATVAGEGDPQISPDGQWLAFTSDASGSGDVYLVSTSTSHAERIRISPNGGSTPRWRGDGGELFYLSDENRIMHATPKTAGDWSDVRTTELFAVPPIGTFAVSPDGQSFLIMETTLNPSDAFFNVVLGQ